jgi:protein-L-isoaspartate(D-aspartate) O-methyltransferase
MVDQQVRTWEVLDPRVLDAMYEVPRELFVPGDYRELAYSDSALPIGCGQTMLAPNLQGRILQALEITAADRVLEVGTGTGYLSACLSLLAARIHSLEIKTELSQAAAANLRALPESARRARVELEIRDAFDGTPQGEYEAIALTGSMPVYDRRFERALTLGGRLFVVVGTPPIMNAIRVRRVDDTEWTRESLFETVIEPLIHAPAAPAFVF